MWLSEMKNLIITVACLVITATTAMSQDLKPANKTQRKVVRLIEHLPEMVEDNRYMTKKGRPYITYIENLPGDLDNYYHVAVCEYNGVNLVPHHRFLVKARTYAIFYLDFWNDDWKPIPLEVWRKRKTLK